MKKNILFLAKAAVVLLVMLLTAVTAWADDISVTYTFSYTSGTLGANRRGHITRQDKTSLTTEWNHGTYGVLWPAYEAHGVDDEYDITFTPNHELDSKEVNNVKSFATETVANSSKEGTTFTVAAGASGYYIKRVTFKNGNTNVATASNITVANSSTLDVLVPPERFFTKVEVELTDNYYGRVTPGSELSITSSPSLTYSNTDYYLAGSTVTLVPTDDNYIVTGVIGVNGATIATNKHSFSFTMPAEDVSPTATLAALSGSCSYSSEFDNCSWHVSDANGDGTYETLTISGTGRIEAYENGTAPWYADFHSTITNLVIDNGIEMIQVSDFYGLTAITEVTLPASVNYIAQNAFEGCSSLARVNIQNTDEVVNLFFSDAFNGCHSSLVIVVPTPALALQYADNEGWTAYAAKLRVTLGSYLFTATDEGGTAAYAITSKTDLRNLSAAVNDGNSVGSGKTFRQTTNITMSGNFDPIGYYYDGQMRFCGTYDGGGYTISGLSVSGDYADAGLFGSVKDGTVKNVRLVSPNVTSSHNNAPVGTVVGYTYNTHVEDCWMYNPTVSGTGSGAYVGAIIGRSMRNTDELTNLYYYDGTHDYAAVKNENTTEDDTFSFTVYDDDGATYQGTKVIPVAALTRSFVSAKNVALERLDLVQSATTVSEVL